MASCPSGGELYFSQVQEASSGDNKYIEIYNPTSASVALDGYFIGGCSNGCSTTIASDSTSTSFEFTYNFTSGASIAAGGSYLLCHSGLSGNTSSCDATITWTLMVMSYNGNDFRALARGTPSSYTIVDQVGKGSTNPSSHWPVCGWSSSMDTRNGLLLRVTNRCCGLGSDGDDEYSDVVNHTGVCSWALEVCVSRTRFMALRD